MYVGVRAGGGIGDEIEDPAGDPYEIYRIVFDITFFFFVIVILLAIIQGLLLLRFLGFTNACTASHIYLSPFLKNHTHFLSPHLLATIFRLLTIHCVEYFLLSDFNLSAFRLNW